MKGGFFTSVSLHAIIVVFGLFSLSQSNTSTIESLPISLVPIKEELSVQKRKEGKTSSPQILKKLSNPVAEVEKNSLVSKKVHASASNTLLNIPFIPKPNSEIPSSRQQYQVQPKNLLAEAYLLQNPEKDQKKISLKKEKNIEDILKTEKNLLTEELKTHSKHNTEKKTDGNRNDFSQTLNTLIGGCIQQNWNLAAIHGSAAYDLRVVVHFSLDSSGMLIGVPQLFPSGGDQNQQEVIVIQAHEALKKCMPFSLPTEKYDQWREIVVNMKAFPD